MSCWNRADANFAAAGGARRFPPRPNTLVSKRGSRCLDSGHGSGLRDRRDRDLSKDDFLLEEDGRPQTIRYFAQESDIPLVLAFLVDTSQSMRPMFAAERAASLRFLERILREDRDAAAVVHFDVRVGNLRDFTSSREQLAAALYQLKIPPLFEVGIAGSTPRKSLAGVAPDTLKPGTTSQW